MTGALKLYGEPISDNEAVTKKYVDENIIYISGEYNFTRGSTVVIGKIPNYNPMRHKVFVSTIEATFAEGHFPPSFIELTEKLQDTLLLKNNRRLVVYVHNLSYEFQFMRKHFTWKSVFSIDSRKPIYAVTDFGIEFRCSYILSGYSLL